MLQVLHSDGTGRRGVQHPVREAGDSAEHCSIMPAAPNGFAGYLFFLFVDVGAGVVTALGWKVCGNRSPRFSLAAVFTPATNS